MQLLWRKKVLTEQEEVSGEQVQINDTCSRTNTLHSHFDISRAV